MTGAVDLATVAIQLPIELLLLALGQLAVVRLAPANAQTSAPQNCEGLSALHVSGATIRSAQAIAAGAFTPPAATDGDGAPRVNPVL